MKLSAPHARGPLGLLTGIVVVAAGLFLAPVSAASADVLPVPAPIEQRSASTVTSAPLPSVQIDSGVVWVQVIAGNTVFAGGSFSNARPAGAAAGTNLMPRSNILAYNINTGVATSFAPVINGAVKAMALSPDGATLYVGGSFNSVDGKTRWNIAAFNVATGALLTTFQPAVGGSFVNAIVATNSTVYVSGLIGAGAGVTRKNFVAFQASNGALLGWAPTSDLQVDAMVMNPQGTKIIAAGRFGTVNSVSQRGLAALDPASGALVPWAAPATVINGMGTGTYAGRAGIWALSTDQTSVYGTGWVFANKTVGNLEGTFAAEGETGNINWIADCHGDHYGVYSDGINVYTTSHQHECSTMGGPPQSNPSSLYMRNATAYTAAAKGTLTRSPYVNSIYADWSGYPAPAAIDWFPDWTTGTFTGDGAGGQAGWTMTGNGTYLLVGGEFPYVNGQTQQGIARFANNVPDTDGPRLAGDRWTGMTAKSNAAGSVRVSIPANWDRDDLTLTYKLYRLGTAAPIATTTAVSMYWNQPALTFTDSGLPAGSEQQYRITAADPAGTVAASNWIPVTVSSVSPTPYPSAVLNDGASLFWRLGTPSGPVESDWAGLNDGTIGSAVTSTSTGALSGDPSVASNFTGSGSSNIYTPTNVPTTPAYSIEVWFKTTTNSGGKLAGYGSSPTGTSANYDRHIYMTNNGRIEYGNFDGGTKVIKSSSAYNNNAWHHVVGTQGPNGMALYIDGQLIGTNSATGAQSYPGYWRLGGDSLSGWPDQPSSKNFSGQLDEFAVYPMALTASQASTHNALGRGAIAPTASFTSVVTNQSVAFDGTGSTAPSGQTLSYAWNFGDGSTGTGAQPTHAYAAPGTYSVVLTVTSSSGLTGTSTQSVVATAPHTAPNANIVSSTSGLTGTFSGTGSTAFDGATITGYQWAFGDGTTSTIANPSHLYAAPGNYTASLVVTDSQGATSAAATTTVSVTHAAPTASFTASATALTLSVDAGASQASDGATLSYDWNWGDGSAHGTGVTASHTYAAASTYTVTLVVTDSIGSTGSDAKSVVTTSVVYLAQDDFARTLPSSWGTAPIGGTWSTGTGLSVASGFGQLTGAAGSTRITTLTGTSAKDLDARVSFSNSVVANGGGTHFNFLARRTAAGDYHLKARVSATGVVTVNLAKTVGTTETLFASKVLTGYTYTAGSVLNVRFSLSTSGGTTTLNGKVWPDGTPEPATWTTTVTDTEASLQVAGQLGISTYTAGTATNGPVVTKVSALTAQ